MYTAGLLPIRNEKVDPGLPTLGTGKYEWTGFLDKAGHPQGIDPADGTITNWNQTTAKGFAAADNEWGHNGSVGASTCSTRTSTAWRRRRASGASPR